MSRPDKPKRQTQPRKPRTPETSQGARPPYDKRAAREAASGAAPPEATPRRNRAQTGHDAERDAANLGPTNKIAGLAAVAALFRHAPQRALRLYFSEKLMRAAGPYSAQMAKMHRPYRMVSDDELTHIAGTVLHGGIVATAQQREVPRLDLDAAAAWAEAGESLFILDGVGNPHNLGAIARSLAFFGGKRLLLSDHPAQAGLSDAAYRIAEGGLEALEIYRLPHLPQALKRLQPHFRTVATTLQAGAVAVGDLKPDPRPLAILLGNEEHGLPPQTQAACELLITIPGSGGVQSLNVSATAAILIYEMSLQSPALDHPPKPAHRPRAHR